MEFGDGYQQYYRIVAGRAMGAHPRAAIAQESQRQPPGLGGPESEIISFSCGPNFFSQGWAEQADSHLVNTNFRIAA
jgi:hypothetical protein